jgi:carbon storage regulator
MLVLSRKAGEQIVIGDNIRVTVVKVHGGRVRLGIEAPKDVSINRQEREARNERMTKDE